MACTVNKTMAHSVRPEDSTKIVHAHDGDLSEWKTERFETDPELKLVYSIDHDNDNLYMAMKITDPAMQMRIAMSGMKMFIDTRGKKKEGTGVEYPIRKEGGGFDDKEDKTQFVGEMGGVNIAYLWGADGTLGIEYRVPIEYLGGPSSVKNKTLSIGWKVNEASQVVSVVRTETTVVSTQSSSPRRSGGGAGGIAPRSGGRNLGNDPRVMTDDPKGQFIWTKHLMNF
jgi:hypothetical protein